MYALSILGNHQSDSGRSVTYTLTHSLARIHRFSTISSSLCELSPITTTVTVATSLALRISHTICFSSPICTFAPFTEARERVRDWDMQKRNIKCENVFWVGVYGILYALSITYHHHHTQIQIIIMAKHRDRDTAQRHELISKAFVIFHLRT